MFGSKKKLAETGAQAIAVVTNVDYAKIAGMTVARNYNYKLEVTLMVRPDNEAPFEGHISEYFSQYAQPSVGDQFYVRYDPADHSKVEIDTARVAAENAQYEANVAAAAASAVPADLAANGIPGRGSLVDVQKTPAGSLVDCDVTVGVRLIDGTPSYRASCHVPLSPDQAERLIPGQTILTVRADPSNHQRIALSLSEDTPVVTVTDASAIDPPARALREGTPCRVVVLASQRQWLKTPSGEELYATKMRVTADNSEVQAFVPVPPGAESMLQSGAELPAKRIPTEPNVITVDWASVQVPGAIG